MLRETIQRYERLGNETTYLRVATLNINGLGRKLDELRFLMEDNSIDVMCLQEIRIHAYDIAQIAEFWASTECRMQHFEVGPAADNGYPTG